MSIAVSDGVDSCIFQNVPGPSFRAAASSSSCWALWRLGNEREVMLTENTVLYNQRKRCASTRPNLYKGQIASSLSLRLAENN
jgi:hypothetical protein